MYLPAEAQDRLFTQIGELSPAGQPGRGGNRTQPRRRAAAADARAVQEGGRRARHRADRRRRGADLSRRATARTSPTGSTTTAGAPRAQHSDDEMRRLGRWIDERSAGRRQGRVLRLRDRRAAVMPRTADDSWDIATSVGATAVMVALARAAETASADPLIRDQFAELLVDDAGTRGSARAGRRRGAADDDDPDSTVDSQHMINYQAVRTHFFDAYFADAAAGGHPSGRDSGRRPGLARLPAGLAGRHQSSTRSTSPRCWSTRPQTLAAHGATPVADRRACPSTCATTGRKRCATTVSTRASRRRGWPKGCCRFCRRRPQEALVRLIDALSGPGSRVGRRGFRRGRRRAPRGRGAVGQARRTKPAKRAARHLVQPVRPVVRRRTSAPTAATGSPRTAGPRRSGERAATKLTPIGPRAGGPDVAARSRTRFRRPPTEAVTAVRPAIFLTALPTGWLGSRYHR